MTPRLSYEPGRIAVLHAKALGDLIVTLPALAALKETYPAAELILLARPWAKAFLEGRPSPMDRVVAVPAIPGIHAGSAASLPSGKTPAPEAAGGANPDEVEEFFAAMRAEQLSVALHMHGSGKAANPFLHRLGAGLTVGMCNPPAEPLDRSIPYVHYQSEVLRNLEVAALVGACTARLEPHVEVTAADEEEAAPIRRQARNRPYVVLHPGAADLRRAWPATRFSTVADGLAAKGYTVIITGTREEEPMVARVMRGIRCPPSPPAGSADFAGPFPIPCIGLGLGGLAALLGASALVISGDTGPLHLARAVGAATVGIYWAPNVLNWGPLTRERHRLAIGWALECPGCGVKPVSPWPFQPVTADCDHPYSFVESVTAAEVLALASELLPPLSPLLSPQ